MDHPDDFSFSISRKAPAFLDKAGHRIVPDPLEAAWKQLQEGFSQLQGQRLLELMHRMLHEMPADESVVPEWEGDESYHFYLRFSNGWSLGDDTDRVDEPNTYRFQPRSEAIAPDWFPRDKEGLKRWKHWADTLSRCTIDTKVDHPMQERLEALSAAKGGLRREHLPEIAQALVGPEWQACLDRMVLLDNTPPTTAVKPPRSRL